MWIVKGVLLGVVIFLLAGISYTVIRAGITIYRLQQSAKVLPDFTQSISDGSYTSQSFVLRSSFQLQSEFGLFDLELLTTRPEVLTAQRRTRELFAEDRMDINVRLERLERENRRMKKAGIVAIVFASVLFISGQAKTNKIVEANEFRLLDASGKERATLHVFRGQPELFIRSLNGESDILLGTDASGPYLIMGPVTGKATVTLNPDNLSLEGPAGKLRITLNHEAGGPNLTIEDSEGYSSVLGSSNVVQTKTAKKEQTPAASLVLIDKDKKVLWSAP